MARQPKPQNPNPNEGDSNMSDAIAEPKTALAEPKAAQKRDRKFTFLIEGSTVTITDIASGASVVCDYAALPADTQEKCGPFGLSAKLSNASAGKTGTEAIEAVTKLYHSLLAGEWTARVPAEKKLTAGDLKDKLANMSDADKEAATTLLAKLGMKLN